MERPNWNSGDTLRSIYGVVQLGKVAVARAIGWVSEIPEKLDTRAANQINEEDDK